LSAGNHPIFNLEHASGYGNAIRITGQDWQIERIDTEPMTQQQYDDAVTALAVLINEWQAKRNNVSQTPEGERRKPAAG
jgi:hypothetical protein